MQNTVKAGTELDFGEAGKSVRLETNSNSIRCEVYGDKNEHRRYLAARSGYLIADSKGANLHRGGPRESRKKKDKMLVDIIPFDAQKYYPNEGDTIVGTVISRNPEFYQVDIGAAAPASLNTLEF